MSAARTKLLFRSAAIFNVLAGIPILLAGRQMAALMGVDGVQETLVFTQITGLAIIGFGWGYWLVGEDPDRNRAIAVLGLALKLCFAAVAFGNWYAGTINPLLPVLASVDIAYAWLFWRHLRRSIPA